jgi:hypothetical protein
MLFVGVGKTESPAKGTQFIIEVEEENFKC